MFNWQINIGNPMLTIGMSFRVRYRKVTNTNWIDFLPNPTQNNFIIPNLDDEDYIAEIRTVCANGTISAPSYINSECHGSGGTGEPPTIQIVWSDNSNNLPRDYSTSFTQQINHSASDIDNDIVLVTAQQSNDNSNWTDISVVTGQNFPVSGSEPNEYFYRFIATDSENHTGTSNVLHIKPKLQNSPFYTDVVITPNACGSEVDGKSAIFNVNGSPNQAVKFRVSVIESYGHSFNFGIEKEGVNIFSFNNGQTGDSMEGIFQLPASGSQEFEALFCLRPCLNTEYSQAMIRITLYENDGVTLSNQTIQLSGYQECP